jgi:heptosyltransferase-1
MTPPDPIRLTPLPRKILIIKPSSLGDVIHALPFLQVMRDYFPLAKIDWVIARGINGILESHPMVNRLVIIDKDSWKHLRNASSTFLEWRWLLHDLRHERYDLVIDLQGLLRSGLLAWVTGAPFRLGFEEAREGSTIFYTHRIKGGKDIHAVDRYLRIASALGLDVSETGFPMPLFKESAYVRDIKKETGTYAVIVPGARWTTKKWPAERFGAVASVLPVNSVVVGAMSDRADSQIIEDLSGGKARSVAGKTTLKELVSLIKDAEVVITNDSGPMHVAAALRRPVVAVFGPTNPARTGPFGSGHITVQADVACAPCYKKQCKGMACMDLVSVARVCDAVKSLLYRKEHR